ncbi:MAG: AIR synthase-related protein, partial [Bacteroidota bacterium]
SGEKDYRRSLDQMKLLNRSGAEAAVKYGVKGMTDITGFGLAGHAMKMAEASKVSFRITSRTVPLLPGAYDIFEKGSIPGATFRNQEFTGRDAHFTRDVPYTLKMLMHDAQTSGGLLMSVSPDLASSLMDELNASGSGTRAALIGEVLEKSPRKIYFE